MFGKIASAPNLIVPLKSARVTLISSRVSAHCRDILFTHAIQPLYFSSLSSAPEKNTGNVAPAETTSEAY